MLSSMDTWQSRIDDLRADPIGMTLVEIAEYLDVPRSTVSDLASGRTKAPTGDAAVKLWQLHKERCGSNAASSG